MRGLARTDGNAAAERVADLDVATGTKLARAFSTYFHLAKITEQEHRAPFRERARGHWALAETEQR